MYLFHFNPLQCKYKRPKESGVETEKANLASIGKEVHVKVGQSSISGKTPYVRKGIL
jgi:hypothetical protein